MAAEVAQSENPDPFKDDANCPGEMQADERCVEEKQSDPELDIPDYFDDEEDTTPKPPVKMQIAPKPEVKKASIKDVVKKKKKGKRSEHSDTESSVNQKTKKKKQNSTDSATSRKNKRIQIESQDITKKRKVKSDKRKDKSKKSKGMVENESDIHNDQRKKGKRRKNKEVSESASGNDSAKRKKAQSKKNKEAIVSESDSDSVQRKKFKRKKNKEVIANESDIDDDIVSQSDNDVRKKASKKSKKKNLSDSDNYVEKMYKSHKKASKSKRRDDSVSTEKSTVEEKRVSKDELRAMNYEVPDGDESSEYEYIVRKKKKKTSRKRKSRSEDRDSQSSNATRESRSFDRDSGGQFEPGRTFEGEVVEYYMGVGQIKCNAFNELVHFTLTVLDEDSSDPVIGSRIEFKCERDGSKLQACEGSRVVYRTAGAVDLGVPKVRGTVLNYSMFRQIAKVQSDGGDMVSISLAECVHERRKFDIGERLEFYVVIEKGEKVGKKVELERIVHHEDQKEEHTSEMKNFYRDSSGIVSRYDEIKGYGFIDSGDHQAVIFVHSSALKLPSGYTLTGGDAVLFEAVKKAEGGRINARNVRLKYPPASKK